MGSNPTPTASDQGERSPGKEKAPPGSSERGRFANRLLTSRLGRLSDAPESRVALPAEEALIESSRTCAFERPRPACTESTTTLAATTTERSPWHWRSIG